MSEIGGQEINKIGIDKGIQDKTQTQKPDHKKPWGKRIGKQIVTGVAGLSLLISSDNPARSQNSFSLDQKPDRPIPTRVESSPTVEGLLVSTPIINIPSVENTAQPFETSTKKSETTTTLEHEILEKYQKAIVVLAKEKNSQAPLTLEKEKEIMQQVAEFYKKESYGKIDFSFDVVDWQEFDQDLDYTKSDEVSAVVDRKLEELEVKNALPGNLRLADYQTRIYVVDQSGKGAISGHGAHREPYNQVWVYVDEYKDGLGGTIHELGHALGLGHVDSYGRLKGNIVSAGGNSVMGNDYKGSFAGPQKLELGWIVPKQVETITQNTAEVTLKSLEKDVQGKKLIKIKKQDTNEVYYIEYNMPDRPNYAPTLNFYIWNEQYEGNLKQFTAFNSIESSDGDEFHDEVNGIRVKQLRHTNEEVNLSVLFEK